MTGFWYLGSPYTKYSKGHDAACSAIAKDAALLLKKGVLIFCPITHCHPIAVSGGIDPIDGAFWQATFEPFLSLADGLIVDMLSGWKQSKGLGIEIARFKRDKKPIIYMEPGRVPEIFAR